MGFITAWHVRDGAAPPRRKKAGVLTKAQRKKGKARRKRA